jgi:hypothetical protein
MAEAVPPLETAPVRQFHLRMRRRAMAQTRSTVLSTLLLAACVWAASPAKATTVVRQGLDRLVGDNELVVEAKVLDIHSYWNAEHTFILTDVRVRPASVMKGRFTDGEPDITFTVLGGSVGKVSIVVVGGPELVPGSDYVLFLSHDRLPGATDRLTVRDLAQGVFDVDKGVAFSQATGDPLLPDAQGRSDVPGGEQGIALDELVRQIRSHVDR